MTFLCRAVGAHAWKLIPPLVVTAHGGRKVVLRCERCQTWRIDVWQPSGALGKGRVYERPAAYQGYLKDHKREDARADILKEGKVVDNESDNIGLRLLHGGRGRVAQKESK